MKNYGQLVTSNEALHFNSKMKELGISGPYEISGVIIFGIKSMDFTNATSGMCELLKLTIDVCARRIDVSTLPRKTPDYIMNLLWGNLCRIMRELYIGKDSQHKMWEAIRQNSLIARKFIKPEEDDKKKKKKKKNVPDDVTIDRVIQPTEPLPVLTDNVQIGELGGGCK